MTSSIRLQSVRLSSEFLSVPEEPVQHRDPRSVRTASAAARLRRLVRVVTGLCAAVLVVLVLTGLFVASFAALAGSLAHPPGTLYATEDRPRTPAPLAVVLGSGLASDTELGRRSGARLETAIRLHAEGRVERLHFTGASRGSVSVAEVMRDYAVARGVPARAITVETRSQTTLQNALFTLREIGPLPPGTILLTDSMHLPRAWVSFVWAGAGTALVLVPADPVHDVTLGRRLGFLARESIAIWLNLGRIIVTSVLGLAGIEVDETPLLERAPLRWPLPT